MTETWTMARLIALNFTEFPYISVDNYDFIPLTIPYIYLYKDTFTMQDVEASG